MKDHKSKLRDYAKYSSIGLQMALGVVIFTWLGHLLDSKVEMKFPLFTLIGVILGVVSVVYFIIKKFG
jgi:F0F1-type ATP synthase assembly protein I